MLGVDIPPTEPPPPLPLLLLELDNAAGVLIPDCLYIDFFSGYSESLSPYASDMPLLDGTRRLSADLRAASTGCWIWREDGVMFGRNTPRSTDIAPPALRWFTYWYLYWSCFTNKSILSCLPFPPCVPGRALRLAPWLICYCWDYFCWLLKLLLPWARPVAVDEMERRLVVEVTSGWEPFSQFSASCADLTWSWGGKENVSILGGGWGEVAITMMCVQLNN